MKRSLAAILVFLGCACQARAAELPRVPAVAAKSSVAPAAKCATIAEAASTAKAVRPSSALQPWPQEASDLKAEPNAVWGKLDNGLRYVILPTKAPGRASLQLNLRVGSLMETKDQQGMAHFLEHLVFNGTKHFPAGELVEYFQRLGMSFGAHTNAVTYLDHTSYMLELPRTGERLTGDGLKFLRDVIDGVLLEQKEIDRERRVIFSEMLFWKGPERRATPTILDFYVPGTLASQREPIGTTETLRAMNRPRFVDFYETWYTPGRATVVAVGNFDVKMVERLIKQNFADAKARRGEQPDPVFGKVQATRGTTVKLHADAEANSVMVELAKVAPDAHIPDSFAKRRQDLALGFANAMLNSRFNKLATSSNSPIQSGSASLTRMYNLSEVDEVSASCQPAQWKEALAALDQELRRALAYGFSDAEFNETRADALSAEQAVVDQADTIEAPAIAAGIVDRLTGNVVTVSPSDGQALLKRVLADLTKEECEQALRKAWQSADVSILVNGNVPLAGDDVDSVLAAYRQSRAKSVAPPSAEKVAPFAYTDFGAAGKIVKREELKDLGIIQTTFANNVRVNVKRTEREKNAVSVQIRFGGGILELPADKPELANVAAGTFVGGGLRAHSLNDLEHVLTGKNCCVVFAIDDDAFQLAGACPTADLETELNLCTAYLTAPGFRAESLTQYLQAAESTYAAAAHTAEGALTSEVKPFLHSGDPRFALPARDALGKVTLDDVKAWLKQPLETGYMEVAIVGDVDPERALQLVAKTFGTLPPRVAAKPAFASQRQVKFPVGVKAKEFQFASETPRALSLVIWPILEAHSVPRDRRMAVLTSVLGDRVRLKVRHELGATYSPMVFAGSSEAFSNYGFIGVQLFVEPKQVAEIGPLVAKMGAELANGKISDDEFDRAMKPILSSLDELGNGYWSNLLSQCQERPELVDTARNLKTDFQSIKKGEIEALAKKYLTQDKATVIGVSPAANGPVALGK
jgi:zinc protease